MLGVLLRPLHLHIHPRQGSYDHLVIVDAPSEARETDISLQSSRVSFQTNHRGVRMTEGPQPGSYDLELRFTIRIRTCDQCIRGHPIMRVSWSLLGR